MSGFWFENKTIETGGYVYEKYTKGYGYRQISRSQVRAEMKLAEFLRKYAPELDAKVIRSWRTYRVAACVFCGARPVTIEWDCDGPSETCSCDDPQCRPRV